MPPKRKNGPQDDNSNEPLSFHREKEKFMGMIDDVMSNKDFSSPEEATEFLNSAFTGRSMSDSLAEWDTRARTPLDEARDIIEHLNPKSSPETRRRHAKKALAITEDCMEAWQVLAWSYQGIGTIEKVLLQGIAHGRQLHAELIASAGEENGLWGYHETRPFMHLFDSLARLHDDNEEPTEAIRVFEEMLALNPGDNQGIRSLLLHGYLKTNRLGDARKLLDRFPDDINLGIVYGRVLLELLEMIGEDDDFSDLIQKNQKGLLKPSHFDPRFDRAKPLMRAALKANPYVPALLRHPTSLYLEPPASYQFGSPDQALLFIHDHALDWFTSMIGWLFVGAFHKEAEILIRKDRRAMRESYQNLVAFLNEINETPWQHTALDELRKNL